MRARLARIGIQIERIQACCASQRIVRSVRCASLTVIRALRAGSIAKQLGPLDTAGAHIGRHSFQSETVRYHLLDALVLARIGREPVLVAALSGLDRVVLDGAPQPPTRSIIDLLPCALRASGHYAIILQ